ncbi:hypothetical protein [Lysinibacillus xylanilyticus]|uniref:Arylsulfotransferase N-terminal domain-containing protein n=1 Tax=Lysinibacillus xylanilyticus TaxID=582475 RepID=A0ABT4EWC5_9BACI|nr:hypothetical protein [Lysinibacillus xylanilyticus]MCY9548751.1 hypothetical protein [Lysinibacillus xylanilyticus]
MKKYWKTILISLIIVTTIGSYYIQQAMAKNVSFKIETTNGDKEEIDNLIIHASYQSVDIYRSLDISKDGSTNQSESFIRELKGRYYPEMFQKYIQEHRKFMRGKEASPGQYFEDEDRLIYTIFSNKEDRGDSFTLQIDILDKNTNESSSFEINMPDQVRYDWINESDVYVENGKIKILATSNLNNEEELHLYTVDENKKELEQDSIIAKIESEEISRASIYIFNENNKVQNENYILYMVEKYKFLEDGEREIISSPMYLYNYLNNEEKEWTIPAELKPYKHSIILQGTYIFIPVRSTNGLVLNRYNIEKNQWEEPISFKYPSIANAKEKPSIQITDGKLYLVDRVSDGHLFLIGDLRTGESLYEGKIINENKENRDADYSLFIEQIYNNIH